MKIESEKRLIVALDFPSEDQIYDMIETLFPTVKFFKIGLEAYSACGPSLVQFIKKSGGSVFLDLKFHDIPRTVQRACLAALELGADIINVHASGGALMMKEAAGARVIWREKAGGRGREELFPAIIAVTLLTHIGEGEYYKIYGATPLSPGGFVEKLSISVKESGLQGVVASGRETRMIRDKLGEDFLIVTPGVRPAGAEDGGHVRKVTPVEAINNGSDLIVVGRPITGAEEPLSAAKVILDEMTSG